LAGLCFLCLPGLLDARERSGDIRGESADPVYTIHLSHSTPVAKIEISVAQGSVEWEVTAAFDSADCEIHCSWRRKRDTLGRSFLLPPIATIRIYTNFVSLPPAVIVVDPAGLGLPGATRDSPATLGAVWISARRLFAVTRLQREDGRLDQPHTHFLSTTNKPGVITKAYLPLRV
jgi:hypothetical protein